MHYNTLFGRYPLFASQLFNFATTPPAVSGTDGGAGGGAATSGGGAPATPPAQPSGGTPGGDGIAQLRTAYEAIKREYEPYKTLNLKPEQIQGYSGTYQKLYGQVAAIGRELGYPDAELVEALNEDPVATLDYLRNEAYQRQQGQTRQDDGRDLQDLIAQHVEQAIAPLNARENERATSEANAAFERVAWQLAGELYKKEGIDIANVHEDETSLLLNATSEILKYDEDALRALKYEGKTAAIAKAFTEAQTWLDKYFVARLGRSNGVRPGVGAGGPPAGGGAPKPGFRQDGKRASLDDLMQSPELINAKYKE